MIQFKVSVPGKLSLFGEHAVNYGRVGLMGSIDLRTTLTFEETSNSNIILYIDYPHIRQIFNIPLEILPQFYNYCVQDIELLHTKILHYTKHLSNSSTDHLRIVHAFFYLFVYITSKEQINVKAFNMRLSTEFLMNNKFACSASITVCLVSCFLHWSCLQKGVNDIFDNTDIKKILLYARHYEEISSQSANIDVFTCFFGTIIEYQDGWTLRFLKDAPNLKILLVDSKQKQCLGAQVQQVSKLMNRIPEIVQPIFDSIDKLTKKAYDVFEQLIDIRNDKNLDIGSRTNCISAQHKELESYIRMNQDLLNALNVSHHLDDICSIARKHGMCGKYTDVDHGGFAYIWCPQHVDIVDEPCTHMKLLAKELTMQRFHVTETKFTHDGIKIVSIVEN